MTFPHPVEPDQAEPEEPTARAGTSSPLLTSQMRYEYASSRCVSSHFTLVSFPGSLSCTQHHLYVQRDTAMGWVLFADVMRRWNYFFLESGGGTYNCRTIAGSSEWSLHAYALALDLNPSKNPDGSTQTDQPEGFRADCKALVAGNRRIFMWGGDWLGHYIDTMHWQIGALKSDFAQGCYDPNVTRAEQIESLQREPAIYEANPNTVLLDTLA